MRKTFYNPRKKILTKFMYSEKLMFINRKKLIGNFQMKKNVAKF